MPPAADTKPKNKNIVLIGFMGVGKSLVAKALAETTGREVLSTDELIVHREGRSITQIFKEEGEAYFRGKEAEAVLGIADRTGIIVDCGGGIALNPDNMTALKKNGIVFYLAATADEIYKNIKDQTHRPLLDTPDPQGTISDLLARRQPFYSKADYIIDANGKTGEQISCEILTLLKKIS